MGEPAKYYEALYFYNGQTTLAPNDQSFIEEVLSKNSAVGVYGIFEEEEFPLYCVSGFAAMNLGYTLAEVFEVADGKFLNLIYEKDRQIFKDAYREGHPVEFRLNTKKGGTVWVSSYGKRTVCRDGRRVCIASVRIIDDSVRRESELLSALAKEYHEIIYIDKKKGKCRQVKRAACEHQAKSLGTIRELRECLHKHKEFIHPEDHAFTALYDRLDCLLEDDVDKTGDYRATYRAKVRGEYIWIQFRIILGGDAGLDTGHAILTFKRVDEEVQRELDANHILSESLAKAEEAGRIKNQFLSRMSHDLRTPINGVMGMVEIARKNADNPKKILGCCQKILVSCQHLMSLVNDVLDMSNLENGNIEFEEIVFDIAQLVLESAEYASTRAAETGIVLELDLKQIRHHMVLGSPKHIRQIFANILDNAVRYNNPGGRITVQGREVSDSGRLAVYEFIIADTGKGMDNSFVKRIFEPFEQEENNARTTYAGTGLGMAIVKKMIDQMHGQITVNSAKGVGTTVKISIPIRIYSEEQQISAAQQTDIRGMKILLVEDNDLNMEIAQFLFEDIGTKAFPASNGQIAVDMFAESEVGFYDMVFMDLMMPVMDGYEATRQIRAMDRADAGTIPIIALSANVLDEDIKRSRMAGMNEHLPKPIDENQVLSAIIKYTRRIV